MPHPFQLRNVDKKEEEIIVSLFLSSICQDGGQRPISPDRPRLYICSAKQHPSSSRHPCWESYNIHFTVCRRCLCIYPPFSLSTYSVLLPVPYIPYYTHFCALHTFKHTCTYLPTILPTKSAYVQTGLKEEHGGGVAFIYLAIHVYNRPAFPQPTLPMWYSTYQDYLATGLCLLDV